MRLCFVQTLHKKNDETLCKLLISKDGSPAIQTDKEIQTSKFMTATGFEPTTT